MSPRRAWLLGWLGGPLIGIANGALRELAYKDRVGELTAHQLSTGSALGLFAGYFELLARRRPLPTTRAALEVGVAWLALTIAFEFGFGHYVAHSSWRDLLTDYDLRKGRQEAPHRHVRDLCRRATMTLTRRTCRADPGQRVLP